MRATGKAYALLTVVWVIVMSAYALLRWEAISLTLPILMVFLFASIFFKPNLDVEVSRKLSFNRVIENQEIEIEVNIKANSPIKSLYVKDLTPNSLKIVKGSNFRVFSFKGGDVKRFSYKVRVPRGLHEFTGVRIVYRDPFGLFEEDKIIELYDEIVGVPRLEDIVTPYTTKGTKVTVGPLPSPRLGEGLEFHAIREYNPGDPMKFINWKATAKTGKIMVNEFESERKVDVVVIVDATYKGREVFDHLMRVAASLLLDALENGMSFGLLISESVPIWVNVDYGKRHFFRCIDVLSMAKPDFNNMILYQVEHLARTKIPPRAQIVFISPLLTEESENAIEVLYRFGYKVVVVSPDPYSIYESSSEEEELAIRILSLKRKARVKKLKRYAVVVDWNVKQPLKSAIASAINPNKAGVLK
ncbi:DUF58 domain-containing protein [Pyrococcus sp. ST04]|uniref:DUF58 domain-containing protein n=1 Tax=Pyrococcus sp. ST04 TaxID=1183377 RepID=UPI0002605BC3|nr:DUF58 domain-containing protein [Pyrococcus sp. ST04]AFK22302.1 hypothetical protein Py04_0700 [Pyrococcus sp. ST04]